MSSGENKKQLVMSEKKFKVILSYQMKIHSATFLRN